VTGDGGTIDVTFVMRHVDFGLEYLAALGFFLGVLALFSMLPVDTFNWLQYCILFVLNAKVSSFPLIFNFIIQVAT
jgi:hypothetical protein